MDRTKYLIIGAGVSGLSFADWIDDDDYLVLEALDEVGGYCKTIEREGFVWDFSGHFFHFRNPEIEQYLVARMAGQDIRVIQKKSRIDYQGHQVDFPFQKNIHQLPVDEFIECLVDVWQAAQDAAGAPAPENFRDMLYARFGRGIAERFLVPYNEKLYATDLSRLDVDAMGRFFPWADVGDIIENFRAADNASYNTTFTYPAGGAIQYVHALQQGVETARICLEEPALTIDLDRKVVRTPKREIAFEYLISSAPFPRLMDLASVPYEPETYTYNKVLVFNIGFDRKGPEGVHWIYFPGPEQVFYRIGFYDNIFGTDRMSIYVEIGYPADADDGDHVVAEMLAQTLTDLRTAGYIDDHEVVAWHTVWLDPAYVHITQRSIAEVARVKRALGHRGVHSIGRYGSWTYCSIEDNIIEARQLAESFRGL